MKQLSHPILPFIVFVAFCVFACSTVVGQSKVQTPSQFLGFEVGADRQLADYKQIVSYLNHLAKGSERIEIESLGATTLGNDMIMAVISSEENLKNKSKYQEIARKLADPRGLSQKEIQGLVEGGKAIVLVTCNIHSTEIGSTQMVLEWAHSLVTAQDEETRRRLDNVILLILPSLNPDGQLMEVEWYRKYVGTKYEGGRSPFLYHPYVGHDDNRDWYMLTQKETKAVTRAVFHEWYPQVWLDEHQMGSTGPRIFTPPYTNPVAENVHPLIWRIVDHIGSMMAWRLEEQKKSGVIYGAMYDTYWPGATEQTAFWKNMVGLLTEVASTRMGTPVEVSPGELSGGTKGLVEYKQQSNFPNPWPGGIWRVRDIMDYERIASDALLESATNYREDILRGIAMMALDAVRMGSPGEFYRIAAQQHDPASAAHLAFVMRDNGVEVLFSPTEKAYYIPTAQPYGRFVKEMLGVQRYPEVKLVAGPNIVPPYDMTAWSLPLMMGVTVEKMKISKEKQNNLRELKDSDWPQGEVKEAGASRFIVSHESNGVSKLINNVLAQKGNVSLTSETVRAGGREFPRGSVVVDNVKDIKELGRKYALDLVGLDDTPKAKMEKVGKFKLGMYKPWVASMDEGWTRWVLEQYEFPLKSISTKDMKEQKLNTEYDVIVIPDVSRDVIVDGKRKPEEGGMKYFVDLPPEFSGGIGKDGVKNLKDFVEQGGTLIAMASACDFVIEEFNVPVQNVLARAKSEEFNCPGSLLRINIDPNHPVTYGMPTEVAGFVNQRIAFQTIPPAPEMTRSVLAWYPNEAVDILMSGWILGAEKLQRRAAAVAMSYGKGKIVLFGFRVQQRAQTEATFKLLFNAIHWGAMKQN
ncbi:MAG: M14 family metallopeptidase [Ignavibacteriales bacterium]|nr:M14 family metallopeptidase [Ignavibacteriales bacterium]